MENHTENLMENLSASTPKGYVLPAAQLVWLLLDGWPARDNQLWAVAESLAQRQAISVIPKKLRFNWLGELPTGGLFRPLLNGVTDRLFGASLANLTSDGAMAITRPWPDLVLSSGSASIPIARWIKRRMRTDRLRPQLVHLGSVQSGRRDFDLIVPMADNPGQPASGVDQPGDLAPIADQIAALLNRNTAPGSNNLGIYKQEDNRA
jgi:mitochondrial fission protein ELM1